MSIFGHRSTTVFRRYNITSQEDKAKALGQVAAYRRKRTSSGTTAHSTDAQAGDGEQFRAVRKRQAE